MTPVEVASTIATVRSRVGSRDGTAAQIHNLLADTARLVAWMAERELNRATEPNQPVRIVKREAVGT